MYTIFILLFLFVSFWVLNDIFAWLIADFVNNTTASVQGKPTDISNIGKVGTGSVLCYIFLTVIMYYTLSLNYAYTFGLGVCVFGFHESNNYATFDKWPISMVILDTLWGGAYFVLVKLAYNALEYLISSKRSPNTNKGPNRNN